MFFAPSMMGLPTVTITEGYPVGNRAKIKQIEERTEHATI
jgi:hypothetical protein